MQNFFLVIASYFFYGWWDWRFLILLFASSALDFFIGLRLDKEDTRQKRKLWLWCSLILNFGLLGVFKYYNFFVSNFVSTFTFLGYPIKGYYLNWILPVGISFYTFQEVSYVIDIYRKKLEPTRDFIGFLAFVSFFPQLVAGPIERAIHLLPQFHKKRIFDYNTATDGMRQILWGLFKKVVIADNCATYVDKVFVNYTEMSGSSLILALFIHAIQIYSDFSGYSDIGIGTARLFGFNLMANFAFPFFSRDIAEFWRRFHISLSSWFRDYIYIPLGGSKKGKLVKIRNIMIVFLTMGFWHGAEWRYVALGAMHGLYFIPIILMNKERKHMEIAAYNKTLPSLWELLKMFRTLALYSFALIFFRSVDMKSSWLYINNIFSSPLFKQGEAFPKTVSLLIALMMIIEWVGRKEKYGIANIRYIPNRILRWGIYLSILSLMFFYATTGQDFIYFQF